jgi:hypothetical protein
MLNPSHEACMGLFGDYCATYYYGQLQTVRELKEVVG